MQIQWYPGHMHKASKEMKQILPKVDLIIEILDARIPFSSQNPMLTSLRGEKPCIKVLNKSDLADPERTHEWQTYLDQKQGIKSIALTNENPAQIGRLFDLCKKLVPAKADGIKTINAMIMGIPNVGKSTLINILAGRMIAKTGNEPAVTKTQQRINLDNGIVLLDTPGVLWGNIENIHSGYRLAATGAIKDTAMKYDDVAFYVAEFMLHDYPDMLSRRYQLESLPASEIELLEAIGQQRGCLRSGGQVDLDKVSKIFMNELRDGTLGRITMETPEMSIREVNELEIKRTEKEAKKAARKAKRKK